MSGRSGEYEKQSGKDVDDDTIIGVVILGISDPTVKEHLVRHAGRLDSWKKMRPRSWKLPGPRSTSKEGPSQWDIGAVPKGKGRGDKSKEQPKGKDKDNKGKGKKGKEGKGSGGSSSSTAAAAKQKGPCFYCQKMGHTKAECRKRLADLKKAEQKGGKGRPGSRCS